MRLFQTNPLNQLNLVTLKAVLPFLCQNWRSLIAAATLCKVSLFYLRRLMYPSGPLPFPFIGNLPALAAVDGSFYRAAETWRAEHGDIFTVWIGEKPWIFINSLDAILQCNIPSLAERFGGRHRTNTGDVQMQGNVGVIFSDSGSGQRVLRSLALQALRKFLVSCGPRFQGIIDTVDNVVELEQNKSVESKHIAEEIVQCLATLTMFGSQLDPEGEQELREAHRALELSCPSGLPSDVIPIFKYLLWSRERAGLAAFCRYNAIARDLCNRTADAYEEKASGDIDCVMDAVLYTVKTSTTRIKQGEIYLTRGNVLQIVFDLFEAGSQTSVITLNWALLKLASDQELQESIHHDLTRTIDEIGYFPEKKGKTIAPRLQSFLREVLRFWPAAPFGLPRKLSQKVRIGNCTLPANSTILFNLYSANRDPAHWSDGNVFNAERFIDSQGYFDETSHKEFLTFGVGSRACVGFTMAQENLFFILARIVQKWQILPTESGISLEPCPAALMLDAKIQNIKLVPRTD
ncbi:cytochrome P450 1A2 [Galendromus occidentalis]|uniref:Cytochrome P450 1A2 n=1 Tax=Galendromus occidentalis TaxID=34638 RepID=A0AAJ6QR25_9ACAR|nr:cytochrome P450 1A2 [Galendromus occidentalis]